MLSSILIFCLTFLFAQASDVVYVWQVQGYSDNNCQTVSGTNAPILGIPASGTCGLISVSGNVLNGAVSVTGNTATLQGCSSCAGGTCTPVGTPVTITNGVCEPASKVGLTGSFRSSWFPAVSVSIQGYSDSNCATVFGASSTAIIPTEGSACGFLGLLVGTASISGNTGTIQSCITCSSATTCQTTGGPAQTVTNGACEPGSKVGQSGSFRATWGTGGGSSNPCFHKDTMITYANKQHTFEEISAHPECSIPHVVSAQGVVVTAKCGAISKTLRLTDGHLVYTQRGLQAAGDLKPGQDTLYADISETSLCQVVSVTKENQMQEYFGLNCVNSQVLASGLKASTFEKLHSVPAFWMQVMGRILGIKRASQWGDYIAELVQKMNLI